MGQACACLFEKPVAVQDEIDVKRERNKALMN